MLDEHPIHQSINRIQQLLAADRQMVVLSGIVVCVSALSIGTAWGFGGGVVLWFLLIAMLQRMGKADPLMRDVYYRHTKYQTYYPAKSGLYARSPHVPPHWRK